MAIEPIKLSDEDRRTLEQLQPDIKVLEEEIAKAKRAGLDVTRHEEDLKNARALLEGVLREYTD